MNEVYLQFWQENKRRNLWQHPLWADFQESVGRKTWMIKEGNATALVVQHKLPHAFNWLEVPRGPLFDDEKSLGPILSRIKEIGKKEKSVFVRMSAYAPLKVRLANRTFRKARYDHHPQTSLIIDLTQENEEILKQMKQKGRYNIKVAQRHDVKIEESEDMDTFYKLLNKTGNRDGFGIHPQSYYESILEQLGDKAELLLARYDNEVVAGGIFVYLDDWGIYYYGASDHKQRHLMAPYLLQWRAMKHAKKRGCKYYDFLGIAPPGAKNHPWAGVTEFKRKFGGKTVQYPQAKDMVLRPFWYTLYRLYKLIRSR